MEDKQIAQHFQYMLIHALERNSEEHYFVNQDRNKEIRFELLLDNLQEYLEKVLEEKFTVRENGQFGSLMRHLLKTIIKRECKENITVKKNVYDTLPMLFNKVSGTVVRSYHVDVDYKETRDKIEPIVKFYYNEKIYKEIK